MSSLLFTTKIGGAAAEGPLVTKEEGSGEEIATKTCEPIDATTRWIKRNVLDVSHMSVGHRRSLR